MWCFTIYLYLNGRNIASSLNFCSYMYVYACNVVVSESSLITGGHIISKVRLMDEENEVRFAINSVTMIVYC